MTPNPPAPDPIDGDPGRAMLGRLSRYARVALVPYWVCLAVGTHWPNLMLVPPDPNPGPLDDILKIDILLHGMGFGGLMLLLALSGFFGGRRGWFARCNAAVWIAAAYSLVDETTQSFVAGREVSLADIVNNLQAIVGVYICLILPGLQQARPKPRWLRWGVIIALPILGFMILSRWAWKQLFALYMGVVGEDLAYQIPIDSLFHAIYALVISILVFVAWPAVSRRPRISAACAMLILSFSGPGVEVLQHFSGRRVEAKDVLAHGVGVLLAMMWWAVKLATSPELRTADNLRAPATRSTDPIDDQAPTSHDTPAEGEPADATTQAADTPRFVGHAVLVSVLTLISRFAGLGRDAVLAAALGLSVAADAFFIGFLVPNLFRRLFGEGALTAAFIPNYTDLLERDPSLAKRFATLTLTLLSVVLVGITLIAELVLWLIAQRIDPDHKASLAIYYTRLMLPYMPLICATALVGGVLQVHKRFGPPAAAPLVLNGVIVLAVLLATGFFATGTDARKVATWVAVGVVIAGALQLIWQVVVMFRVTGLARSFADTWPTMKSMLLMMGPMIVGLAVFQINALLDALIAFFFAPSADDPGGSLTMLGQTFAAPLRNGDVAALNWSQRLYQFPLGVFGIAIATAIFPALAAAAARFNNNADNNNATDTANNRPQASNEFAEIVRHGLRLTVFIALPASVGLILVRVPLARTVFEHGDFNTSDALRVSVILAGYASSVWAYSMTHALTRAFYALKDATTPLKVSACMVALNLVLNLSLIWSLGAAGLAWSTAISAAGQVVLLLWLISRRVPTPVNASVFASWRRTALASLIMVGVLLPITLAVNPTSLSWWASTGLLLGLVVLGAAIVLGVAWVTKAEELNWLRKRSVR